MSYSNKVSKYPKALTPKGWTKAKPLITRGKTGITSGVGAKLKALEAAHKSAFNNSLTTPILPGQIQDALDGWDNEYNTKFLPLKTSAEEVTTAVSAFVNDVTSRGGLWKSVHKSTRALNTSVGGVATTYANDIAGLKDGYKDHLEKELPKAKKKIYAAISGTFTKTKITGAIADVEAFHKKPTKSEFEKRFTGDSNMRGYVTLVKAWGQIVASFREFDNIFNGNAEQTFSDGLRVYGANKTLADLAKEKKVDVDAPETYVGYANEMNGKLAVMKRFDGCVDALIEAIQ